LRSINAHFMDEPPTSMPSAKGDVLNWNTAF
jgi:hypothetical protein